MFQIDMTRLTPRFLLEDQNGFALAMAIRAGLEYFLARCGEALACVNDVDQMPEWRLDEMAWELNCIYDYAADVEMKRRWIKSALPYFWVYGTAAAIKKFMEGYFTDAEAEEWFEYGGEPYHFRMVVEGTWSAENQRWLNIAVERAKNLRSVLDHVTVQARAESITVGISETHGRFVARRASDMFACGGDEI